MTGMDVFSGRIEERPLKDLLLDFPGVFSSLKMKNNCPISIEGYGKK
jgi:hypothetical protein